MGNTPELIKKHTLFAKVVGNTVYNMIKLNECEVIDERPVRPEKIISVEVGKFFFDYRINRIDTEFIIKIY